jgi:hypothetical protein
MRKGVMMWFAAARMARAGLTWLGGIDRSCVIVHPGTGRRTGRPHMRATNRDRNADKRRYGVRSVLAGKPCATTAMSAATIPASIAERDSRHSFTGSRESRSAA